MLIRDIQKKIQQTSQKPNLFGAQLFKKSEQKQ